MSRNSSAPGPASPWVSPRSSFDYVSPSTSYEAASKGQYNGHRSMDSSGEMTSPSLYPGPQDTATSNKAMTMFESLHAGEAHARSPESDPKKNSNTGTLKPTMDYHREHATQKAMELMENLHGEELAPKSQKLLQPKRQSAASAKAMDLMEGIHGSDLEKGSNGGKQSSKSNNSKKSAMELMEEIHGEELVSGSESNDQHSQQSGGFSKPMSSKAAAQERHKARKEAKKLAKELKKTTTKAAVDKKLAHLGNPLEKRAQTTRKLPELTPDDVRDPESIRGMKCQMDIDREVEAEKKAAELLNSDMYIREEAEGFQVIV